MSHKQTVAILGSTGSIGTQTLDVIDRHSELFEVYALTAHSNIDLLISPRSGGYCRRASL